MAITTELVGKLGGGIEWHTEVFNPLSITANEVKKTLTPTAGKVILASAEVTAISVSNTSIGIVALVTPNMGSSGGGSYDTSPQYPLKSSSIGVKQTIFLANDTRVELSVMPPYNGTAVASVTLRWCEVDL